MHRGAIHTFLSSIGGGTSQQGTCNAARVVSVFAEFLGRKADAVRAPANAGVIGTIERRACLHEVTPRDCHGAILQCSQYTVEQLLVLRWRRHVHPTLSIPLAIQPLIGIGLVILLEGRRVFTAT